MTECTTQDETECTTQDETECTTHLRGLDEGLVRRVLQAFRAVCRERAQAKFRGSEFAVQSLEFGVQGLGFSERVQGLGFTAEAEGAGLRIYLAEYIYIYTYIYIYIYIYIPGGSEQKPTFARVMASRPSFTFRVEG